MPSGRCATGIPGAARVPGVSGWTARVGWLLATALTASFLVVLSPAPATAVGPSTRSILSAVNAARAAAGRPPLSLRSDLSGVAHRWSQRMASSGTLAHNPGLTRQVTGWRWVGENVGYGPDWRRVQVAFMNSPSHRSNILDRDYTQIGIGVVVSRSGRIWITQVFRKPSAGAAAKVRAAKKKRAQSSARPARPAATRRPAAKPKPVTTPAQLLEQRISTAEAALAARPGRDPLAAALGFADAMRAVGA